MRSQAAACFAARCRGAAGVAEGACAAPGRRAGEFTVRGKRNPRARRLQSSCARESGDRLDDRATPLSKTKERHFVRISNQYRCAVSRSHALELRRPGFRASSNLAASPRRHLSVSNLGPPWRGLARSMASPGSPETSLRPRLRSQQTRAHGATSDATPSSEAATATGASSPATRTLSGESLSLFRTDRKDVVLPFKKPH